MRWIKRLPTWVSVGAVIAAICISLSVVFFVAYLTSGILVDCSYGDCLEHVPGPVESVEIWLEILLWLILAALLLGAGYLFIESLPRLTD